MSCVTRRQVSRTVRLKKIVTVKHFSVQDQQVLYTEVYFYSRIIRCSHIKCINALPVLQKTHSVVKTNKLNLFSGNNRHYEDSAVVGKT